MHQSPRVKQALQFAARKHDGHYRKEVEKLPYVSHLVSVAWIAGAHSTDEEVVMSALLHDTVEDTDTTPDEIEALFGKNVRNFVEAVTEPKETLAGMPLSWKERKEAYLAQLEGAPPEAHIVSAADKVDNIESKVRILELEGTKVFELWKQAPDEYLWFHAEVLTRVQDSIPQALHNRFVAAHNAEKDIIKKLLTS